jgi:hypothetical protein
MREPRAPEKRPKAAVLLLNNGDETALLLKNGAKAAVFNKETPQESCASWEASYNFCPSRHIPPRQLHVFNNVLDRAALIKKVLS